jgi:methylthioribose-1-phosphate isomerase
LLPPTIAWEGDIPGRVRLLDQTLLPGEIALLEIRTAAGMADAIRRLAIRGAPAIGVAGAFGLVLGLQEEDVPDASALLALGRRTASFLRSTRPTAVSLVRGVDRTLARVEREAAAGAAPDALRLAALAEARATLEEDREACRRIAEEGSSLLRDGQGVLTHCNTGALATTGIGTALGIVLRALERGMRLRVFAGETRPLLQGSRLTALELKAAGVDVTLLADVAAGSLLRSGRIGVVLVGADRIARNGDVANKVGTYPLALLAREHGVPFYVAAPIETIDPQIAAGSAIPVEERGEEEVLSLGGRRVAPEGVKVFNPAFDVTPARLVTGIVTEAGQIPAPDEGRVVEFLRRCGRARE